VFFDTGDQLVNQRLVFNLRQLLPGKDDRGAPSIRGQVHVGDQGHGHSKPLWLGTTEGEGDGICIGGVALTPHGCQVHVRDT